MSQLPLWEKTNALIDAHFPLAVKPARPVARARKSAAHLETPCHLDDFERYDEPIGRVDPQTGYVEEC